MYNKEEVLQKVDILYNMWKKGSLGGEVMPEDANPHLDKSSVENYLYISSLLSYWKWNDEYRKGNRRY